MLCDFRIIGELRSRLARVSHRDLSRRFSFAERGQVANLNFSRVGNGQQFRYEIVIRQPLACVTDSPVHDYAVVGSDGTFSTHVPQKPLIRCNFYCTRGTDTLKFRDHVYATDVAARWSPVNFNVSSDPNTEGIRFCCPKISTMLISHVLSSKREVKGEKRQLRNVQVIT